MSDISTYTIDQFGEMVQIVATAVMVPSSRRPVELDHQPIAVPDKPARATKSHGSTYEVYGIHGISRDEANHLIVALDRVPSLRYLAIDLMRLVHPLLDDEEYGYE